VVDLSNNNNLLASKGGTRYNLELMAPLAFDLAYLVTNAPMSAEDRIAEYTLGLTIFTAVLAIVSCVQIWFLIRSDKTARVVAEAAKKSAEMAEASVVAGSRAVVSALDIVSFWERDTTNNHYNWRFCPQWVNSGKTPTKNMRLYTACELRNTPLPPGFDFNQIVEPPGRGLLAPSAQRLGGRAPFGAAITPQDIADVQESRKFLYVWGWARYFDIFPDTPEHTTMFCWRIHPIGDPFASGPDHGAPPMQFPNFHHDEGNQAT
jgi:hypothetical protein